MKSFKIEFIVDGETKVARWGAYSEQQAIAQLMLYEAQNGAREIKIVEVIDAFTGWSMEDIKNYKEAISKNREQAKGDYGFSDTEIEYIINY